MELRHEQFIHALADDIQRIERHQNQRVGNFVELPLQRFDAFGRSQRCRTGRFIAEGGRFVGEGGGFRGFCVFCVVRIVRIVLRIIGRKKGIGWIGGIGVVRIVEREEDTADIVVRFYASTASSEGRLDEKSLRMWRTSSALVIMDSLKMGCWMGRGLYSFQPHAKSWL